MATTLTNSSTTVSDTGSAGSCLTHPQGRFGRILICILLTVAALFLLNKLFMPKYMSGIYEGALVAEYYASEKNHQLLIIGDCEAYENISPITLWEEYGITSYIRGSAQQLTWQSYYLLEDAFRYEKPQTVIFSVLAMKYKTPQSEAYNRLTLDGMRLSSSKIEAIKTSMTQGESLISYLLPLFRYHDRWQELSWDDVRYLFKRRGVSHNGFMMRCDVKPLGSLPTPPKLGDYALSENCWAYLDKIRELCAEHGAELILVKAPVPYPHWYPEWDAQVSDYAVNHRLLYLNALNELDAIGINFTYDTYDGGLHLNLNGAEKFSRYLGGLLNERGLPDLRHDEEISAIWAEKVREYTAMKDAQLAELEITGRVATFLK
ncbi:MAG: SGNH/GDSL hydrolase family protein [Firmicutes bacterium]|nr:SGNH/GDSL hydrolase family protein [Bacillota bacterium]